MSIISFVMFCVTCYLQSVIGWDLLFFMKDVLYTPTPHPQPPNPACRLEKADLLYMCTICLVVFIFFINVCFVFLAGWLVREGFVFVHVLLLFVFCFLVGWLIFVVVVVVCFCLF